MNHRESFEVFLVALALLGKENECSVAIDPRQMAGTGGTTFWHALFNFKPKHRLPPTPPLAVP